MHKRQLLLLLLVIGCGTSDYEETALDTLHYLKELEEADLALGPPVVFKETKDPNGTVITRDLFLRLPKEMYPGHPNIEAEHGKGYRLFNKYSKTKGGAEIPRMVMLAFADESDGNKFEEELLGFLDIKDQKGTQPKFKVKDDLELLRFETKGHERTILFLCRGEKTGVVFQFETVAGQDARQDAVAERSMKYFRLNSGAEDAKSKYEQAKAVKGN